MRWGLKRFDSVARLTMNQRSGGTLMRRVKLLAIGNDAFGCIDAKAIASVPASRRRMATKTMPLIERAVA